MSFVDNPQAKRQKVLVGFAIAVVLAAAAYFSGAGQAAYNSLIGQAAVAATEE